MVAGEHAERGDVRVTAIALGYGERAVRSA
jgi:hypothetical protein